MTSVKLKYDGYSIKCNAWYVHLSLSDARPINDPCTLSSASMSCCDTQLHWRCLSQLGEWGVQMISHHTPLLLLICASTFMGCIPSRDGQGGRIPWRLPLGSWHSKNPLGCSNRWSSEKGSFDKLLRNQSYHSLSSEAWGWSDNRKRVRNDSKGMCILRFEW